MKLSDKIKKSAIKLELRSDNKWDVIDELVDFLCDGYRLDQRETILEAILKREAGQSTGVGMEIAVPHAKTPVVDKLYVVSGLSKNGIDFDSVDGKKVKIFFLLVSPRDVSGPHIKALAGISRLVKHEGFRASLLECDTAKKFIKTVKEAEKKYL